MNLAFDSALHEYRLDGAVVPSVTAVLSPLYDFSKIVPVNLERKRQIGMALDELIALDFADDLDESTIYPALAGYFNAWRRFRSEKSFVTAAMQQRVGSEKYRYAGTPDAWGSLDGHDALVDWKATSAMHPAVGLQTAAYAAAGYEMGLHKLCVRRYGVQFCPDGKYNIVPYAGKTDFNVFLSFLSCWNWRTRNGCSPKEKP